MKKDLLCYKSANAQYRLVLLHGWGATAEDLVPIGQKLESLVGKAIELVSLNAPGKHPDGLGRQWYGLFPPDWLAVPSAIDDLQIRIKALETRQIPLTKTVLLGFSQGGAMAMGCGCNLPLAGLIACSAYPHPSWSPPKNCPPVLLAHGNEDAVVPLSASEKLLSLLKDEEVDAELLLFNGGHEIPFETLLGIQKTLIKWFSQ